MFQFQESGSGTIDKMETAAFADIIFLLLIFFLLSSSFILPTEIPVNPPQSESAVTLKDEPVVVTLTADGGTYVDDEKVPASELGTALAARLEHAPTRAVLIRGDESVELRRLVEVMDTAQDAGADRMAIATERKSKRRR